MPYFAKFVSSSGHTFRLDTRIYLSDPVPPSANGVCVAAIIGKNPGSAMSATLGAFGPLTLQGDKMLPTVRNVFLNAYSMARKPVPAGAFVRVWNLFYLCSPSLTWAIRSYAACAKPPSCKTESSVPPIVWFAWGGNRPVLNQFKTRFLTMTIRHPFFFDKVAGCIRPTSPTATGFAKHPQGLPSKFVIHHLASVL